jgi:hypothetical protein
VRIDTPITVLSLLGLAFLLFLAGLELDLDRLRGPLLRLAGSGFLISVAIGVIAGWIFHAIGYLQSPFLLAVALSATSLGLVVPILKDAGQLDKDLGQLTVAGSSVADFGAVLLLSFFFSESSGNSSILLIAGLAVLVVIIALALSKLNRSMRLDAVLTRPQDTTAEIRVRMAIVLLVGFRGGCGEDRAGGHPWRVPRRRDSRRGRQADDEPPSLPRQARGDRLRLPGAGVLRREWDPVGPAGAHPEPVGVRARAAVPDRAVAGARPAGRSVPPVGRDRGAVAAGLLQAT